MGLCSTDTVHDFRVRHGLRLHTDDMQHTAAHRDDNRCSPYTADLHTAQEVLRGRFGITKHRIFSTRRQQYMKLAFGMSLDRRVQTYRAAVTRLGAGTSLPNSGFESACRTTLEHALPVCADVLLFIFCSSSGRSDDQARSVSSARHLFSRSARGPKRKSFILCPLLGLRRNRRFTKQKNV
jgi:hypothetical protein